jgi:hypothetical protein
MNTSITRTKISRSRPAAVGAAREWTPSFNFIVLLIIPILKY